MRVESGYATYTIANIKAVQTVMQSDADVTMADMADVKTVQVTYAERH